MMNKGVCTLNVGIRSSQYLTHCTILCVGVGHVAKTQLQIKPAMLSNIAPIRAMD